MQELVQSLRKDEILQINIHHKLTNRTVVSWITHYVNETLYVGLPQGSLPDGSKDAFVGLLEYAEDVLMCKQAIVFFPKDRSDRANLVRTFMFMGFSAVSSDNPMLYKPKENSVYMVYNI